MDDREAERELERLRAERAAREAEEEEGATKLELERKKAHKSLADILGIADREKKKAMVKKVAVVIDPVLGVKLRPHQVEGVKFLYRCASGMTDENAYGCVRVLPSLQHPRLLSFSPFPPSASLAVASWPTRWDSARPSNASPSCGRSSASPLSPTNTPSTRRSSFARRRSSRTGRTSLPSGLARAWSIRWRLMGRLWGMSWLTT